VKVGECLVRHLDRIVGLISLRQPAVRITESRRLSECA